jgi:hypothetical protein
VSRLRLSIYAIVAAISTWTALASHLFVWFGGLSDDFPAPWSTWWLYVRQPHVDGWTAFYLIASGILAAVPVAIIMFVAARVCWRAPASAPLHGETHWDTDQRPQGKISTNRSPF